MHLIDLHLGNGPEATTETRSNENTASNGKEESNEQANETTESSHPSNTDKDKKETTDTDKEENIEDKDKTTAPSDQNTQQNKVIQNNIKEVEFVN